jgi:hypothetical protein
MNIIRHPHVYARDLQYVKSTVQDLIDNKFDEWDKENDRTFRSLLLSSVNSALKDTVAGLADLDDPALVTWIKIVREWTILTREQANLLIDEVKACNLKDFPGMNVSLAVEYLRPRLDALYETREYDPSVLLDFLRSLHGAYPVESSHHYEWWSYIQSKLVSPLEIQYEVHKLQMGLGPCEIEDLFIDDTDKGHGDGKGLDRKSILDNLKEHYQLFYNKKCWPAASSPHDSKGVPPAFGASAVHHAEATATNNYATKADIMALVQNLQHLGKQSHNRKGDGKGGGKDSKDCKDGACHACGAKDHWKNDPKCPKKQGNVAPSPATGTKSKREKINWKYIGPKSGDPTSKTVNGTTWYWCNKCRGAGNSKGRWTATHTTDTHGSGTGSQGAGSVPATHLAELSDYSPCAWYTPTSLTPTVKSVLGDVWILLQPLSAALLPHLAVSYLTWWSLTYWDTICKGADLGLATTIWLGHTLWCLLLQVHSLVGWGPFTWILALLCLQVFPPYLMDPAPADPEPTATRTSRKQRRCLQQCLQKLGQIRYKGASIKDYGYCTMLKRR